MRGARPDKVRSPRRVTTEKSREKSREKRPSWEATWVLCMSHEVNDVKDSPRRWEKTPVFRRSSR